MAGERASFPLRELLVTTKDGDWGIDSPKEGYVPFRVIRGADFPSVRAGETLGVPIRYLDKSTVHRRTLEPDDIVFETAGGNRDRPTGRSILITARLLSSLDLPATCASFARFLRVDRDKADPRYVYWYLQYLYAKGEMSQHQVQHTGVARFQYTKFAETERIPLPNLAEQQAIARILGTLDHKIELNRRMNETMEAMARALFKSWFVDFDPVRAKAEGRDTGLPKPLADLFPDSFEDSELGEIPKGWGTHHLRDLLGLDKGLSYKGEFLTDTGVPMVNLGCLLGRGRFAQQAIKPYSGEFKPRHVIGPRDLVLANTDITQKREVLGSPALVPPQGDAGPMIFSHHVFAARFHEGKEPWKLFVYFLLLQDSFRERATGFATGTTVLALPRDAILDLHCPAAPPAIVQAFDSIAFALIERQWESTELSRTLAALRDTLLPKLISGEIRAPIAEASA